MRARSRPRCLVAPDAPDAPTADRADANCMQVVLNLATMDVPGTIVCELSDKDNESLVQLVGQGKVRCSPTHPTGSP